MKAKYFGVSYLGALTAAISCVAITILRPSQANAAEFEMAVNSIDEVAEGAMPEVIDISATSAVISFQSNMPLACSVVYGTTPEFGQIAIDADMDGGAHSNHRPVLAGLRPETDYYFRVQGTASDGRVFVGQVRKFKTLAPSQDGLVDLATMASGARVVSVSSNYGDAPNDGSWGANWAIDGTSTKAWSSAGDGDDAFIEIELEDETDIGEVAVWSRDMSNGTARILSFELTFDGTRTIGPFDLPDAAQAYVFPIDITAKRIRFDVVESTGGNTGLIELEIFEK